MLTKNTSLPSDNKKQYDANASILIALLYGTCLTFFVDWNNIYEFDPDEGYNVIKALMLENGFTLYREIWSDQPPAFTYVLWFAFKVFGSDVHVGRMVVIAFSSLMVFGIYDSVRRIYGVPAALGGAIFLLVSYRFTTFSIAIMLGTPSLSMAVMSGWAIVVWYTRRRTAFLLASGAFLGASVSLKLFTLFIVPIGLLCIILFGKNLAYGKTEKLFIGQITLWLAAMAVSCLVLFSPALFSLNPSQLITAHAGALLESRPNPGKKLWQFITYNWPIIAMSILGSLYAITKRSPVGVFFGLWLVFATIILFFHHPVWYHHALLLLIPASVMAGLPAQWFYDALAKRGWNNTKSSLVASIAIVLIALAIPATNEKRARELTHPWHYSNDAADRKVTEIIDHYAGPKRTMITSRQMYAFKTKHAVPPFLSVTSSKRFRAGLWTAETIIGYIESDDIEQVVLNNRWTRTTNKTIEKALQGKYTKVYSDKNNRGLEIFVRNDIVVATRSLTQGG